MRSTSRLLNAAEIARISSRVTIAASPPLSSRGPSAHGLVPWGKPGPRFAVDTGFRRYDNRWLAGGAGLPQHIAGAVVVEPAAEHEQMVGEAIQVFDRLGVDRLGGGQGAHQALGP